MVYFFKDFSTRLDSFHQRIIDVTEELGSKDKLQFSTEVHGLRLGNFLLVELTYTVKRNPPGKIRFWPN